MEDIAELGLYVDSDGIVRADKSLSKFNRTASTSEKRAAAANREFATMGRLVRSLGPALAALGVGIGIGSAIQTTRQFSQAIADLSAITGAAGDDLAYYREQAAEIGRTTSLSASQAADAFKLIASAKPDLLESAEALTAVTKEAVTLAEATGMTLPAAAEAIGSALNQFQLDASKTNEVINLLAASAQKGTAPVESVTQALRNSGAAAQSLGVDLGETVAGIQALAAAGRQGADAGTALRQVLLRLESTGDQTLMPSVVGLNDALQELSTRQLSNTELMDLFGQEAFTAATSLLAQKDVVDRLNVSLRGTNTATEQAATRMDTLNGDILAFQSAMEGLAIGITGGGIESNLRAIVQAVTDFVNATTGAIEEIKEYGRELKLVAGILGTAATAYVGVQAATLAASAATVVYTGTLAAFSAQAAITTAQLLTLRGALSTLAAAGSAFVAGWQVGSYLREEFEFVERLGIAIASGFQKTFATLEGAMRKIGANISYALTSPLDFARTKIIDFFQWLAGLGEDALDLLGLGGMMDGITAKLDDWRPETEAQFRETLEAIEADTQQKIGNIDEIYSEMFANVGRGAPEVKELVDTLGQIDPEPWKEFGSAVDDSSGSIKKMGDSIARVSDMLDQDEFGFFGYEDPFDSSTWVQQAQEVEFAWGDAFGAIREGLGEVQSTMADGSKEAKALGQAMQALQVAQGISAILTQGMGDPYTAFSRMAAMAASVASLIGSVGFAGQGDTTAEDAQAIQGTGGVLGDSAAKSESAINALEIQVKLQRDLVGINTGMLSALRAMEAGISGAANLIMRGGPSLPGASGSTPFTEAADPLFGDLNLRQFDFMAALGLDFIGDWLNDALGGSSDVINEGIAIAGGAILDLINNTVVSAFQDVEEKKHILDDKDVRRYSEQLGEGVSSQFSLIFGGMVDAVTAAAEVLGMADSEIQSRIARFRVAATEISTMDLTGEEEQAEISAVFSQIFDNLAQSVVPYVGQFQQGGEAIAETLIRVASQVQATEEAVSQLGLSILDNRTPEQIAQISDELTNAAGGIEAFVSGLQSFVSTFASDEQQLAIATDQVSRAFDQLNQGLPASREGLWTLMQTLTNPNDIATVLSLTDALDQYYSALEEIDRERQGLTIELLKAQGNEEKALAMQRQIALEGLHESNRATQEQIWALNDAAAAADRAAQAQQAYADFQRGIADQILDIVSPAHAELERLNQAMAAQIAQAQELGIAEDDLTNMRRLHQLQIMEFAAGLEESIKSLSDQLFGGEVESQVQQTVRAVDNGMNQIRESMISAIEGVQSWLNSSQLSAVSPLTPDERLGEAERQFNMQFSAALGGDVDAISALPQLADQFLSEASTFFGGSTAEFDQIWMQVRDAMQQVTGIDVPDRQPDRAQQTAIKQATESTALSAFEQIGIASDILGQVAAYSRITEESPAEIARRLDVPLGDLIGILGETPERTAGALDGQFNNLVTGFDMTIDPLLSVQQAQLEATQKQTEDQNERLERIEMLLERGVQYDAVTANNTGHTAVTQEQLAAEARKNRNMGSPQQRIR